MKRIGLFILLGITLVIMAPPAWAQQRGGGFAGAPEPVPGWYENGFALVVGINAYPGGWPKLSAAVSDARKMAKFLAGQDIAVTKLLDEKATAANIIAELRRIAMKAGPNDRLIFYYSGHGYTEKAAWGGMDIGYLVPTDGKSRDASTYIPMDQLRSEIQNHCRAKHVLFIMDSCFSGTLLTRAATTDGAVADYLAQRGAYGITAGMANQPAVDGLFTDVLIEGLNGNADYDNNGYITFKELGLYAEQNVRARNRNQTPDYGTMLGSGQFVFARKGTVASIGKAKEELDRQKAEFETQKKELVKQMAAIEAMTKKVEEGRIAAENERKAAEERKASEEQARREAKIRKAEKAWMAAETARVKAERHKTEEARLWAERKVTEQVRLEKERKKAEVAAREAERKKAEETRIALEKAKVEQRKANAERLAAEKAKLEAKKKRIEEQQKKIAKKNVPTEVNTPAIFSKANIYSEGKKKSRFEATAHWSIRDTKTGLEWFVGPDRDMPWKQSKKWAETLAAGGGGWSLPSVQELRSLYEKGAGSRNMDLIFHTNGWWLWAESKKKGLDFANGGTRSLPRRGASFERVFAVRKYQEKD